MLPFHACLGPPDPQRILTLLSLEHPEERVPWTLASLPLPASRISIFSLPQS